MGLRKVGVDRGDENYKRTSIYLGYDLREDLDDYCRGRMRESGAAVSFSEVIRDALEDFLALEESQAVVRKGRRLRNQSD